MNSPRALKIIGPALPPAARPNAEPPEPRANADRGVAYGDTGSRRDMKTSLQGIQI
jgi:hypothetical protein